MLSWIKIIYNNKHLFNHTVYTNYSPQTVKYVCINHYNGEKIEDAILGQNIVFGRNSDVPRLARLTCTYTIRVLYYQWTNSILFP